MRRTFLVVLLWLSIFIAKAEVLPPTPPRYFNDFASVVSSSTTAQLNQKLEQFDRETSTQVIVAIYPEMETESSIEDYTFRIAEKWKVGQKDKDNGAVLFVFMQNRQMFLQVGYGLESVLPDALAKQIIEYEIKPAFQSGDYDQGLTQGVNAILAAIKGSYQSQIKTNQFTGKEGSKVFFFFFILLLFLLSRIFRRRRRGLFRGPMVFSSGGFWGGGGGGGFSGGGGGFGGGGAGGRW